MLSRQEAPDVDFGLYQELWDTTKARPYITHRHAFVECTAQGTGKGLLIAWRRDLQHSEQEHTIECDTREGLAVLVPCFQGTLGRVLLISVHVRPALTHAQNSTEMSRAQIDEIMDDRQ